MLDRLHLIDGARRSEMLPRAPEDVEGTAQRRLDIESSVARDALMPALPLGRRDLPVVGTDERAIEFEKAGLIGARDVAGDPLAAAAPQHCLRIGFARHAHR